MSPGRQNYHKHVQAIIDETGEEDPFEAVRVKARRVITDYVSLFGEQPPFNLKAIASVRGLHWSDDDPRFSPDSEIAPEADGRVVLRVSKSRPESRQRFSIGHEIGHTLFPEYQLAVRCRKGTERNWAAPEDLLETLCDVAASELMFPDPWFRDRIDSFELSAANIAELANYYIASRDATVRRLVELHPEPMAAVFFSWKLKPTEQRLVNRNRRQKPLFGEALRMPSPMLRVDYAILNDAFERVGTSHIPKNKSVPSVGPIHAASVSQTIQDGHCHLDLGTLHGRFRIHALPVFTSEEATGPDGASSIVAILRPL
ncbi:ImmA/IrrE family metallo-endopeptidase [Gimesia benthica]|nr:ImmA/IrrE family metallo-endopeptidase [Gimesia benthica]